MKRMVRASIRDLKEYERVEIPEDRMGVMDAVYSLADKEGADTLLFGLLREMGTDEIRNFVENAYDLRGYQYVKSSNQGNRQHVNASIVQMADDEDYSNDIPTESARDALFEFAEEFGTKYVLDNVLQWFSAWDLKPLADDIFDNASMKYEE